jgi:hypothetical protein
MPMFCVVFLFEIKKDELAAERSKSKGLQYEMEKCIADLQSM